MQWTTRPRPVLQLGPENFAAAGLYAFRRRLDVEDVEIVEPGTTPTPRTW